MKKHLSWLLPLLGIFLLLFYVRSEAPRTIACGADIMQTPHDVIVTAFDEERDAVLSRVQVESVCSVGETTYHIATYEGETFIMYMSGVGPEEAARTTRQTLDTFTVELLVFSGIAGAVDQGFSVGDTVVVETWYDNSGGEPVAIAETYIAAAAEHDVLFVDGGVSVDYFVTDTSGLPDEASVVDMETYVVASIAHEQNVPFIAFRSVSDFADGGESSEGFALAASESADVALAFIAGN